jgi:hypothetical protein
VSDAKQTVEGVLAAKRAASTGLLRILTGGVGASLNINPDPTPLNHQVSRIANTRSGISSRFDVDRREALRFGGAKEAGVGGTERKVFSEDALD